MRACQYLCAMKKSSAKIEMDHATVECVSPDLIELRFKPSITLTSAGLGEVIRAKEQLCVRPMDVLAIFPPDLDLELNVLSIDHRAMNNGCGLSRRLAIAAQDTFTSRLAEIYFRYHPRDGETAVFLKEAEARDWLASMAPAPSLS